MKLSKKLLLILSALLILLTLSVLAQKVHPEQDLSGNPAFLFPDTLSGKTYGIDSLKILVGENKILPEGFELQALLALSAYPELKSESIEFVFTKNGAPLESSFRILTLLRNRAHRFYRVNLNNAENSKYDPVLLRNLPFDAQVGILAHELGHITYYKKLSTWQIANWGIKYLISKDFRAKHEKTTDLMPVTHGLGSQIYQYAWHVRNNPECKPLYESYKGFIDQFYLTDVEIREFINRSK